MEWSHNRGRSVTIGCLMAALIPATGLANVPLLAHEATLNLPASQSRSGEAVSVSADSANDFCVTDAAGAAGVIYDELGIPVFTLGPVAQLASPMDLTSLASGGFACTDGRREGGRTIRCFNFFGEPVPYLPESPQDGWMPDHLLVLRDGNFVTADASHGLLAKHDGRTGALLWKQSVDSESRGEIMSLGRPAEAPDGRIYLPLGGARSVAVLSSDGERLETFGEPGTGTGRLSFPVGVAFCPDGNVAVLDRMRAVVLVYDSQNVFQAEFGQYGGEETDLYHPLAIAAGSDGRIYVVQGFLGRIHVFHYSTSGTSGSETTNPFRFAEAGRSRTAMPRLEGEGCL
jgi:hypothetical protein